MKSKIIADTNTLVSSLLFHNSTPQKAIDLAQDNIILFSEVTMKELEGVLCRPKFDKYVSPIIREVFLRSIQFNAQFITVQTEITICRDPKDNKFLELAVDGQADYLITGDRDLLVLHPFQKTQIITPADFLNLYQ